MAASSRGAAQPSESPLLPPPKPPQNPTPLSASQEAGVRDLYHKRVRAYCSDEIRDFAQCAAGRTFTATWACRATRRAMNACMIAHATQEEEDAARREWFAKGAERAQAREQAAEQKKRYEAFKNEWWGDYREREKGARGDGTGGH